MFYAIAVVIFTMILLVLLFTALFKFATWVIDSFESGRKLKFLNDRDYPTEYIKKSLRDSSMRIVDPALSVIEHPKIIGSDCPPGFY